MGVIHPQHGIDVAGGGASALRNLPRVFVGATGRDAVVGFVGAGGSVFVGRAFGVFVVEDAVWMHGVGALGVVVEDDLNGVADFRADERAEESEMFPFGRARLQSLERGVRVFAVESL